MTIMRILELNIKGVYRIMLNDFDFKIKRLIVFDLWGNILENEETPSDFKDVNLSGQPSGTYLVSAIYDTQAPPFRLKIFKEA